MAAGEDSNQDSEVVSKGLFETTLGARDLLKSIPHLIIFTPKPLLPRI